MKAALHKKITSSPRSTGTTFFQQKSNSQASQQSSAENEHSPFFQATKEPMIQTEAKQESSETSTAATSTQANASEAQVVTNQVDDKTDEEVNAVIDGFPDPILKGQLGTKIKDRRDFLIGMQKYLGGYSNVVNHFSNIRKANVPGKVHLHDKAASRIESVQARMNNVLNMELPATTVGLGLRGRYRPHKRESRSRMAHPMGYALDYRAFKNPMITDKRLVRLLAMIGGRSMMPDLGMKRKERRSLLQAFGKQMDAGGFDYSTDLGKKASAFIDQMDEEYNAITQASQAFTESLPEQNKAKLLDLKSKINKLSKLEKKLKQLYRKQKKAKGKKLQQINEKISAGETSKNTLANDLQGLENRFEVIFKPWLIKVRGKKKKAASELTLEKINELEGIKNLKKLKKQKQRRQRKIKRTLKALTGKVKRRQAKLTKQMKRKKPKKHLIDRYQKEISKWESSSSTLNTEGALLEKDLHSITLMQEYKSLDDIEKMLLDEKSVFSKKRSVKNPAIAQLVQDGYFSPEENYDSGEKHLKNKSGFSIEFMELMALHGFDQGLNWSPGSTDAMHFELVEGVDSLKK